MFLPTFAISLQLFCASLICFSLCSSAAVHGVLVRLFLALGSGTGTSSSAAEAPAVAAAVALSAEPAGVVEAFAIWSAKLLRLRDLRFRELAGETGWGAGAADSGGAVTGGWELDSSAGAADWVLCWGEGLRVRLLAGAEELWDAEGGVSLSKGSVSEVRSVGLCQAVG